MNDGGTAITIGMETDENFFFTMMIRVAFHFLKRAGPDVSILDSGEVVCVYLWLS